MYWAKKYEVEDMKVLHLMLYVWLYAIKFTSFSNNQSTLCQRIYADPLTYIPSMYIYKSKDVKAHIYTHMYI
jgi:hypothetical protein